MRLWGIYVWYKCTQLHKNSPIDPKCLWWEIGLAWGGKTWLPTAICAVCGVSFDACGVNKTCHTPTTFGNHMKSQRPYRSSLYPFVYRGKPCYIPTKTGLRSQTHPKTSFLFVKFAGLTSRHDMTSIYYISIYDLKWCCFVLGTSLVCFLGLRMSCDFRCHEWQKGRARTPQKRMANTGDG